MTNPHGSTRSDYSIPPPPPQPVVEESPPPTENVPVTIGMGPEATLLKLTIAVLVAVTGVVAWANYAMLLRERHAASPFRIEIRSALERPGLYTAAVEWRGGPPESAAYPQFLLDGLGVPIAAGSSALEVSVPPAREVEPVRRKLGLWLPASLPAGQYDGALRLAPRATPAEAALEAVAFPFTVFVPGWQQEWWLLVAWLETAAGVLLLAWSFALYCWPAPRGSLRLAYLEPGEPLREYEVHLGWRFTGMLMPWRRWEVDVARLISRRPWGKPIVSPLSQIRIQFHRLEMSSVFTCVVQRAGDGLRRVDRREALLPSLAPAGSNTVSMCQPVLNPNLDWWFVVWPDEDKEDQEVRRIRWIAFRHVLA